MLLTISLLVSNRIDTIRKCMESLRPLLEQLPSELIVVDTVGEEKSDGSLNIAKEYATKVVHFDWCNDFAAARNAGLSQAQGEWFMFLDDDEWFEDVTEIIDFFVFGEYLGYESATYLIRNYVNQEGILYNVAVLGRMIKRRPDIVFVGRIHETFSDRGYPCKAFSAFVHHYGYVFKNEEEARKHFMRNVSLLKEEIEKNPEEYRLIVQLVQEYKVAERFEEEQQLCERTLTYCHEQLENPLIQYLIVSLASVERRKGNWEEGEQSLVKIEQQYPMTAITRLVCIIEHIIYEQLKQNQEQVLYYVREYLRIRYALCQNKETYVIAEFMDAISEEKQQEIVLAGLRAMLLSRTFEHAASLFEQVNWTNKENLPYEQLQLLFSVYEMTENGKLLFKALNKALQNPKLHMAAQTLLNGYLANYPEKRATISKHLAGKFDE